MDDQGTNRAGGGMRYRKLRIAFSVTCGMACVLSVVLWVRTKYAIDSFGCSLSKSAALGAMSRHGGIGLILHRGNSEWSCHKYPADEFTPDEIETAFELRTAMGFVQYAKSRSTFRIRFPYWSLVLT